MLYKKRILFIFFVLLTANYVKAKSIQLNPDMFNVDEFNEIFKNDEINNFLKKQRFYLKRECPLKSSRFQDLVEALKLVSKGLKNGLCKNNHQELIDSLGGFFENINMTYRLRARYDHQNLYSNNDNKLNNKIKEDRLFATEHHDINKESKALYTKTHNILGQLTKAANDPECSDDLRKRGILSALANVSSGIGQMALLVPSPSGLTVGAGGVATGSILQVISALFHSTFEWDKESDRKQFQELNCSFFDIRNDLESLNFFSISDEDLFERLEKAQVFLNLVKSKKSSLNAYINKAEKEMTKIEKNYLETKKKDTWINLWTATQKVDLSLRLLKDKKDRETFTLELIKLIDDFSSHLKDYCQDYQDYSFCEYLGNLIDSFKAKDPAVFFDLSDDDFFREIQRPILLQIKELNKLFQPQIKLIKKDFLNKKGLKDIVHSKTINNFNNDTESIIKEYDILLDLLSKQVNILSIKKEQLGFGVDNSMSHTIFDVIKEYQKISEMIFGKTGWNFIKYLRDESKEQLKIFVKNLAKFREEFKWDPYDDSIHLEKACRNANNIRLNWEHANASKEVFLDFLDTNRSIIHSYGGKDSWFKNLILFRIPSYETKIHRALVASDLARFYIKKERRVRYRDIKKIQRKDKNFGVIVTKINKQKAAKEYLDKFLKERECFQYF